jgi:hypothetical protein
MYRPVLRKLLKQEEAGFRVKMAEGYAYEAQWELISGTSATTLKNIIKVSFGDYVALRRIGLTPIQAFGCLGIYCGDDSVSVALPFPGLADARVLALADLAMEQKLIVREAPSPVSFLGEFHYGAFFRRRSPTAGLLASSAEMSLECFERSGGRCGRKSRQRGSFLLNRQRSLARPVVHRGR